MLLSEFDIVYITRKAIKGSVIANCLAELPIEDYESMKFDFPDEDIMALVNTSSNTWTMMFDGATNEIGHGVGAILMSPDGKWYPLTAKLYFDCTNNMAEYEACSMGVRMAYEMKVKKLRVLGDSLLVVHQLNGEWETRDAKLIPYNDYIRTIAQTFDSITFEHVPRESNQVADALATLSAMFNVAYSEEVQPIRMEKYKTPSYCMSLEREPNGKRWYHDIKHYIAYREYPPGASENSKRTIRRLAMEFFLNGEVLYKRNYGMTLLRCVDALETEKILEEIHEGVYRTHKNRHMMAMQVLRAGYFWLPMESNCIKYVRRCYKCQIYADKAHAPTFPLHVLTAPWPFSMWGLDVIGPIEPKASNGHRFILVAIDYFTKWVEVASYKSVTKQAVVKFIRKDIICRYGLPERIITDNGKNLNNKLMEELCNQFKVKHSNSTPYRPKMNGAVETANKNIKKILEKMSVTYRDWHEMLPFALHGYRISVCTSTGATPFSLVYGFEAVLPVEVEVPSLRVIQELELDEAKWAQVRYEQLNFIEERRLTALCRGQLYQKKIARAYNKKVRHRHFQERNLVLKRIMPFQKDHRGKWTPYYEGPCIVKKAFSGGALILTNMDGDDLPSPISADYVKKYYA